jgi:hypothetical protein
MQKKEQEDKSKPKEYQFFLPRYLFAAILLVLLSSFLNEKVDLFSHENIVERNANK